MDKYFRCYATVDLDKIRRNVLTIRNKIDKNTGIVAVIKTDGYGHGAVPVAKALDDICAAYAVATAYEGHNLRRHGITKPIFILGYADDSTYEMIVRDRMIPAIFRLEDAKVLSNIAKSLNMTVDINIAVDTGMSRIGYITSDKSADEIVKIGLLSHVNVYSIFTHFAKADYKDKRFAYKQFNEFKKFIDLIEDKGLYIPVHQCANSAAMMEMPETSMQLSRIGISMYGLYPSEEMDHDDIKLEQAMSIYSHVVHVKTIEKGRGISYGQTFVADRTMKIATIPVGYGDGYPRNLSNTGYVLIKGKKAPIVGRVCMDQFMVDVTDLDVKVKDKVTLAGKDGEEQILIDYLSLMAGTFNYEFVCDIGKRVPRIYYKDNQIVGCKDYYDDDYEINI
jgi:alanine racemase